MYVISRTTLDMRWPFRQALTKELLEYLRVCDLEFKPDLTAKVCQLIQRYSPERRWYIDSMLQVRTLCTQPCCTESQPVCDPPAPSVNMLRVLR